MNLTEISRVTKTAIAGVAALVVVYLIGFWLKTPISSLYSALFPPKDLPTVSYGILPQLQFTEQTTLNPNPIYKLNTRLGTVPTDLPTKLPVLRYNNPSFSYGAGAKAQKDAATLGFTDEMRVSDLAATIFTWNDVAFGGTLSIDTSTNAIDLYTPLGGKGTLFPSNKLTRILAIDTAKKLLQDLGRWNDQLYTSDLYGYQEVTFGKFGPSGVLKANSTLDAQFAKVDFFRQVDEYPIFGPRADESLLSITLREPGSSDLYPQLNFPRMNSRIWNLDLEVKDATYPLIPASLAWQEVSQGNGIISSIVPNDQNPFEQPAPIYINEILINEIYLGYYDNSVPQQFMQPIYIFEGNFVGDRGTAGTIYIYYPAVSGEYVQSNGTPVEQP